MFTYITATGEVRTIGMLIDWDLAKFFKSLNQATQPMRSVSLHADPALALALTFLQGTWQFMSARLLLSPGKKNEVADDIESFIHVFRWMCLRFYQTSLATDELYHHILGVYEACNTRDDGQDLGGSSKRSMILQGACGFELIGGKSALSELVDDLTQICQEHYLALQPATTDETPAGDNTSGPSMDPQSQTKQNALMRDLQRAKKTSAPPPPPPTYTKTLSSHDVVIGAFAVALMKDKHAWNKIPKSKDRFLEFKDSPLFQHWFNNSSLQSTGKRSLESDSSANRPAKHARRGTGSRLESVTEDVQTTSPPLASK